MFRDVLFHISECGDGWGPAVLETEVEHDFIRLSQKGLTNEDDYFIGGSTYPGKIGPFNYPAPFGFKPKGVPDSSYSPSQSGNDLWNKRIIILLNKIKEFISSRSKADTIITYCAAIRYIWYTKLKYQFSK